MIFITGKCGAFRSFLAMEHSEENLSFWIDCESYKYKKPHKRRKAADAIFRKFIQTGAENEVKFCFYLDDGKHRYY